MFMVDVWCCKLQMAARTRGSFGSSEGCGTSSILPVLSYLRPAWRAVACSSDFSRPSSSTFAVPAMFGQTNKWGCPARGSQGSAGVPGTCSSLWSSRIPRPIVRGCKRASSVERKKSERSALHSEKAKRKDAGLARGDKSLRFGTVRNLVARSRAGSS